MEEHVSINRDHWNGMAADWVAAGEAAWASELPYWGIWAEPESALGMLPGDMRGMEAVELGCGTGYVSGWMARRGARVTGIDISSEQLATARRLAEEHGADIRFLEGNAEVLPFEDARFDFAISEYGAAIWCDPAVWLREAWRVLKPGGQLVFLGHHAFIVMTTPLDGAACERVLHRPYRTLGRTDWTGVEIDPSGIEFSMTFSGWIGLFREIGFSVEGLKEIYAPEGAVTQEFGVPPEWARDFPSEHVWWLRKG
ncbi:MAG: class I SAM-dependent methyltransferase [Roseovarius sp.]